MNDKLSACLIVKDEEPCIEKCLKSIRSHVDEIIVVDTGSTDNTVKIAEKYTDKVLNVEWVNDFSAARNFSIKNATHDWIFVLDADNEVTEWDEKAVGEFIEQNDPRKVGNAKIISLFEEGGFKKKNIERENKLFNRQYYRYEGIIHEQVRAVNSCAFERSDVDITMLHSGYQDDEVQRKQKAARNISMLKQSIEQNGESCYLVYQLGKAYELDKNYGESLKCYSKAITFIDNFQYAYVRKLIISYGYALLNKKDFNSAIAIEKYKNYYGNNPDYNFLLAYIYMMNAQFSKAVHTFLKCTTEKGEEIEGVTSWLPFYNIGVIYECLGNKTEALKYYSECGEFTQAKNRIKVLMNNR